MNKYTNAAELGRLAGRAPDRNGKPLSRQRMSQILASGDIPHTVRVLIGDHPAWRIPLRQANQWLRSRGIEPPEWVKRVGVVGAMEDVWVGTETGS